MNLDSDTLATQIRWITLGFAAVLAILVWKRRSVGNWTDALGKFFSPEPDLNPNVLWRLFWVSFAALYIEIMMIRWIGTEIRVFAYFQNLALIACFLGFGLGCYWARRYKSVIFSLLAILGLVVLVEMPVQAWQQFLIALSTLLSLSSDAAMWGQHEWGASATPGGVLPRFAASVITVAVFLLLLVAVMIPLGQWVGYYLDRAPNPIKAYSANLVGSVVGIWMFAAMSYLWLPPSYWFVVGIILLLLTPPRSWRVGLAATFVASAVLVLLYQGPGIETHWSPYQKLQVVTHRNEEYTVQVNNTGYMSIANMTPENLARTPDVARRYRFESSYDAPYRFAQSTERVLIVGSGAGNDVAAALRNGAAHVDAVEIDPVILSIGQRLHPERPYSSPKVTKVVNDARAFLRQTHEKYDVVMFGLLDSHTQFSDYSNMRVDNYVYTDEAFRRARGLLKPNGIMVLKFEVRPPWTWMGQRFNAMLHDIFGRTPVVFYAYGLGHMASATVFIESDNPDLWNRTLQPELAQILKRGPPPFSQLDGSPPPTTDDWPYIYHRSHSIPQTYLTVSLVLLAITLVLVRGVLKPGEASTWQFFFLGAGFLLLETQMITRLALYFGTTWMVNCVALSSILLVLVLANFYVSARNLAGHNLNRLGPYYALLIVFLLGNFFFPWHRLPYAAVTIGILLSIAYAIPVFFAGVIFTETFRRQSEKSGVMGANIMGAVAGGLAQNLSFIFGMKALLIFAAMFYLSAALCGLARGARHSEAPEDVTLLAAA